MRTELKIVAVDEKTMTLAPDLKSSCNGCHLKGGCGVGIFAEYFARFRLIKKPLEKGVRPGEKITLEMPSKILLYRAFQMYMLPIFALFFGAFIGVLLFPENNPAAIFFAFSGFFATILALKFLLR